MNTNNDAAADVRQLFYGAIPERRSEVDSLFERIAYRRADDRTGFHLESLSFDGAGLITLTDRTMQQIWLISYLTWRALHEQSGFLIVFQAQGKPYDLAETGIDLATDNAASTVSRLTKALQSFRDAESDQLEWPIDVPILTPDLRHLRDDEDHLAYDLGLFATAFVFLHEAHHTLLRVDGVPYGGIAEELECDRYAIKMLIEECDRHAEIKKYDVVLLRRKRAMGAMLGLIVVMESTDFGLSQESATHPPIGDRIKLMVEAADRLELDANDDFWIYATCSLLSKLRREARLPQTIPFTTFRSLFIIALDHLSAEASPMR